jgi:multidrug efflux system membrane fusion protein
VRLLVDTMRDAILVPSAAIQHSPQGTFVYVVKADQTVHTQEVTVRLTEGEATAIEGAVGAGDLVVTDGIDKLQQGAKVTLQKGGAPKTREAQ